MDLILLAKAFILGMIEGATEFLPISSTGHLIIVGDLLDFNNEKGKVFEIVIQLGAIMAVCWEYRRRLANVASSVRHDASSQRFVLNLAIAFMPAAVLGLIFHPYIKTYLFSPITVACALIVGGFAILVIERLYGENGNPRLTGAKTSSLDAMSSMQALKIGFAQSLAMFPGVSRSGATILGGMVFGLSRKTATEFSFFVAIPVMIAATGYDLFSNWDLLGLDDLPMFAVGFITAFFAALLAVKTLLHYVGNHDFRIFAWYRIAFGTLVLAYFW